MKEEMFDAAIGILVSAVISVSLWALIILIFVGAGR